MTTMLDYVKENGQRSFADFPLNEVDLACLNELGYLTYQERLPDSLDWQQFFSFVDLKTKYVTGAPIETDFLVTSERLELLDALAASKRFEDLQIGYYINDISSEYEKQFAAMVMTLPGIQHTQVIFRGTDDTMVGWKEDFNMTYRNQIPAQYEAVRYLEVFLAQNDGQVVVTGHSKGGNLALYASTFISANLQDRIRSVYVLDAPGLRQQHLTSPGYLTIKNRIQGLRPQESIVGIMLPNDFNYQTVDSNQTGMHQHKVTNWQVEGAQFKRLPQLSAFSRSLEEAIEDWRTSYSSQELKLLVDTSFDLFFDAKIESINDLMTNPSQGLEVLASFNSLDKDRRDFLTKAFFNLVNLYNKHSAERAWVTGTEQVQEFFEKWQSKTDQEAEQLDSSTILPNFSTRLTELFLKREEKNATSSKPKD